MNAKFIISYDGTQYFGSQKQIKKITIENSLLNVFKTLNISTKIILSGRTDKNVHALGQVFNCILPKYWYDLIKLQKVMNKCLDASIRILSIIQVKDDFHARFDAKKRVYKYIISSQANTAFNVNFITYVENINFDKINEAIKCFIGVHDFYYFHKQGSDKENTIREIFDVKFYKYKNIFVFKFVANSYLRSQIRLMVGFLLKISDSKLSIKDLENQLMKKKCFFRLPAKANALYLTRVVY